MSKTIIDGSLVAAQYPFVLGLRQLNMELVLIGPNQFGIRPASQVTPRIQEVAKQNHAAIIAELTALNNAAAADRAEMTTALNLSKSNWEDPRHDFDKLQDVLTRLFAFLASLGEAATPYYDGPNEGPAPDRPYCYVKTVWLDNKPQYQPILADRDGQDCYWVQVDSFDLDKWMAA
jgi:hypothetical protein